MPAEDFNKTYIPIYAPDGFPKWCNDKMLYSKPNTSVFAEGVKEIQERLNLTVDGYCGEKTIEAIAKEDWLRKKEYIKDDESKGMITIGPKAYQICAPVVHYFDDPSIGDTETGPRLKKVHQIVTHYDVSYNARATEEILEKRGYSTHFIIDGDKSGTIFQCHPPLIRRAFHAKGANKRSIGVDLNNPADVRYEEEDFKRRNRMRDIFHDRVHGGGVDRLGYFPEQIDSYNALLDVLCPTLGILRRTPRGEQGKPIKAVVEDVGSFNGIVGHYHISNNKTDPAPLDWNQICPIIKQGEKDE